MAEQLQKFVSQNKDVVETVMEVFEQGAEVVASIAGDLFPLFSIAAPLVKLALDNVESKEAVYMAEQFQKVRGRLEAVSEEIQEINDEIKKSGIDVTYFSVEENLTHQFRKFMEIFKAKPEFKTVKKDAFMECFKKTGGVKNLHKLYNAVTGNNFPGESVLEIMLKYEQNSRRPVEEFCAMLKQLFCIGLIALLGHAALEGYGEEEKLLQEWGEKMKEVQSKITVVVEDCINSYPTQAELEAKRIVRDHSDKTNQQLADMLTDHLKNKYDWVFWSVRVFNSPKGLFTNKKDFQGLTGKSRFQVMASDEKLNVVISYSASPEPVDKDRIQTFVSEQKKPEMTAMAEQLFEIIPHCVVHTVKTSCKDLGFSCSFSDELHYNDEFKNFYVFLHSA
ncbi:protein rapunzel-like [Triplophysa dalaica]|uniref:protein rapunzel-like n=1 Tax=Triplophysa dalaica TaxID=1582913 RepID=UPI0024DFFF20|nr:protein rapunzel-like [Triplophysa dalaica]XP_056617741.1 protein rapunzel-like [Triplophysa dalaica]